MNAVSMPDWPRLLGWYALAVLIVLADQYTKGLATTHLQYGRPEAVFSWFNLTLQHNTGAAFSFLSTAGGWQRWFFSGIAVVVSVGLVIWLYTLARQQWLLALSLSLILGGAIGNLWDRLVQGYVVDFVSLHYGGYYFPAFNVADSAITVGAICMILDSFLSKPEQAATASEERGAR